MLNQDSTSWKKPWGQLAPKFSDLVASKSISVESVKSYRQWKKIGRIGDPSGRNVKLCRYFIL